MPTTDMAIRQPYSQHTSEKYVAKQQNPASAATPGFHPGTSPADYCNYCGTYLPAQVKLTLLPMDAAHVYQPGGFSQMTIIPQQSFPNMPQDMKPGYFIPGQYHMTTYVPTPQYPVPPGTSTIFPGTIPAYTGTYYSAQTQFTPQVQPGCVIVNAAVQQQQKLPLQHIAIKQECRPTRIRDPHQGVRDITDEILLDGRGRSTPSENQCTLSGKSTAVTQTNCEMDTAAEPTSAMVRPDDARNSVHVTPEIIKREALNIKDSPLYTDVKMPQFSPLDLPPSSGNTKVIDAPTREHNPTSPSELADLPPPLLDMVPTSTTQGRTETGSETGLLESGCPLPSITNVMSEVESKGIHISLSPSQVEVPVETPNVYQESLCLPVLQHTAPATSSGKCNNSLIEFPSQATSSGTCDDSSIELPGQLDVLKEPCRSSASSMSQNSEAPANYTAKHIDSSSVESYTTQQLGNSAVNQIFCQDSETPATSTGECDGISLLSSVPRQLDSQRLPAQKNHEVIAQQVGGHTTAPSAQTLIGQAILDLTQPSPAPIGQEMHSPVVQVTPTAQLDSPIPTNIPETITPIVQAMPTPISPSETLETITNASHTVVQALLPPNKVDSIVEGVTMVTSDTKEVVMAPPAPTAKERDDTYPPPTFSPVPGETALQAGLPVSKKKRKKKRKMKDLNKKEAMGDPHDAFTEVETPPEPEPTTALEAQAPMATPVPEETDMTCKDKEDIPIENIHPNDPKPAATFNKYQFKEELPVNPKEKKKYDRDFLLSLQYLPPSLNKPEDLPNMREIVLDKATKMNPRQLDSSHLTNSGPDLPYQERHVMGGGGRGLSMGSGLHIGPPRYQQVMRTEPRRIIMTMSDDVQLNKAEKAWKPSSKKPRLEVVDPEETNTQDLFKCVRGVLNKLTPENFPYLTKQMKELPVNTEYRLKGVINLIFEKAISEPIFSAVNAEMCYCLQELEVPTTDKPKESVMFKKLLLDRCQQEFKKHKDDVEIFEKKQKELDATPPEEDKQRLEEELDKDKRYSLGNIKFIGELFKLKMLRESIMHTCIEQLLKNHDLSLECLCRLLVTIGKDLDSDKHKPRMDQYFNQIEKLIRQRKTSKQSQKIRFMLEDVLDLRRNCWVPRHKDEGPKTLNQIHKDAQEEHMKFQPIFSKKEPIGGLGGRMGQAGGRGFYNAFRVSLSQDSGWTSVPMSNKSRAIDTLHVNKKLPVFDINQQLGPGSKCMWGSIKGSSDGNSIKLAEHYSESVNYLPISTMNRYSAPQQPSSLDLDKQVHQRNTSSKDRGDRYGRFDRREDNRDDRDRLIKRERDRCGPTAPACHVGNMLNNREWEDRERDRGSRDKYCTREPGPLPPSQTTTKTFTEEEVERRSTDTIKEYLHINNMKEALACVQEMNSAQLLFVFVRKGVEITLDRKNRDRENLGLLLYQLIKAGMMPTQQYYRGLQEVLEEAEDRTYDCPHLLLYLAELISPMLQEGGIPMGQLFNEISKPLIPLGKAGDLLVHIILKLCKGISLIKVRAMWREAGLNWKDFLPENEDVVKFVTDKNVQFTLSDESESGKDGLRYAEINKPLNRLMKNLDRLIQDKDFDWNSANLDEEQTSSNMFIRALMTCICRAAIISDNPPKVDIEKINQRADLLQKYLSDEQKELQALYALQALMVEMEQPRYLLLMFFDTLYNGDVIKEEAFYRWESSNDPAEQQGKSMALKYTTTFFTWLREAEIESDHSTLFPTPPSGLLDLQERLARFQTFTVGK